MVFGFWLKAQGSGLKRMGSSLSGYAWLYLQNLQTLKTLKTLIEPQKPAKIHLKVSLASMALHLSAQVLAVGVTGMS